MPKKGASLANGPDSGVLLIDERTKAVMTDQPRHAQEAFREQITRVREVVAHSKDDIALVLQYHDGDVDKAIQSFMEDGAKTVLNEWRSHGKKNKSRNKKKRKGQQQKGEAPAGPGAPPLDSKARGDGDVASAATTETSKLGPATARSSSREQQPQATSQTTTSTPTTTTSTVAASNQRQQPSNNQRPPPSTQDRPSHSQNPHQQPKHQRQQPQGRQEGDRGRGRPHPKSHSAEGRGGDGRPARQQQQQQQQQKNRGSAANHIQADAGKNKDGHPSETVSHNASGERLHSKDSHEPVHADKSLPHIHDTAKAKKLGAVIERSSKDLHRTSVALTRHKGLLREKLEQAEKSIGKSFEEIQRFMDERKLAVTNEFLAVKQEAIDMLEAREEQGRELEMKTLRAATMPEDQLMELRAEIKHFVSDRKVDEEIGKARRYTWNPDQLVELIKSFGEVTHIQHHYSTRRPSISSLSSLNTVSRTASVSEDPAPLSARSLGESHDSASMSSHTATPRTISEMDVNAEAAELFSKIQRGLTQGRKGQKNAKGPNPQDKASRSQGQDQRSDHSQGQRSDQNQGPRPDQRRGQRSEQSRGQRQDKNQGQRSDKDQGQRSDRNQGQRSEKKQHQTSEPSQGQAPNSPERQQRGRSRQDRPQGSRQGAGQAKQGQGSNQGHRSQQGQSPHKAPRQQQEQEGQRSDNKYAKRRQNRSRRQREEQDDTQGTSSMNPPVGQEAKKGLENDNQELVQDAPSEIRTDSNALQSALSVVPDDKDSQPSAVATLQNDSVAEGRGAEEQEELAKEVPATSSDGEEKPVNGSHAEVNGTHDLEQEEKVTVKDVPKVEPKLEAKVTTNGPLVNGNAQVNGDVPHVNGDINEKEVQAPLPQREGKSRRAQKIEQVGKENVALNGVPDAEPTEKES